MEISEVEDVHAENLNGTKLISERFIYCQFLLLMNKSILISFIFKTMEHYGVGYYIAYTMHTFDLGL